MEGEKMFGQTLGVMVERVVYQDYSKSTGSVESVGIDY